MPMTLPRFFQLFDGGSVGKYVGTNKKNALTQCKIAKFESDTS